MESLAHAGVDVLDGTALVNWSGSAKKILEVVSQRHAASHYSQIRPLDLTGWATLRGDLFDAVSGLEEFVHLIRERLERSCGVFIPSLGLERLDTSTRASIAYAIAGCIGNPTATDAHQVVWDVKVRPRNEGSSTYFSTFSETDTEADYHTDTQYYPFPEPIFCLYVVEEARCGGGFSSVLDARALRLGIEKSQRWLARFLETTELPFRVPSAFASSPDFIEATLAPVFDVDPLIRYRKNTLAEGLEHFKEFDRPDVSEALAAFRRAVSACPQQVEFFMPRDSLVVLDNHRALHARTAFTDHERHLLRIRMRDEGRKPPQRKYKMLQKQIDVNTPLVV